MSLIYFFLYIRNNIRDNINNSLRKKSEKPVALMVHPLDSGLSALGWSPG